MKTYILLTNKSWHDTLYTKLAKRKSEKWIRVSNRSEFSIENLSKINPDSVFIPHWSSIIPLEIFENYECIVFHMTDLPYGRGGSPLQNLIVRGHKDTMISALRVNEGIDTGDIYMKSDLSLDGSARDIFLRSSVVIESMINKIIDQSLQSVPQTGIPVEFKRRKPSESDISDLKEITDIYNYIRMLDADGYPNAFIESGNFRFEFSKASIKSGEKIIADVRIIKK